MFSRIDTQNLKEIIDYINTSESPEKEFLEKKIEDLDLFLNVIASVKVSKFKKILQKPNKKNSKSILVKEYNEQEVLQLISNSSVKDIIEKFSLTQLKSMFESVYGNPPMSKLKKADIANTLKKRLEQIKRVDSFNEIEK